MCAAGSPKPKGTSCSSNGGEMCDFLGSCVVCVTDLDCNDSTKRCYLQSRCVDKNAITATPLFSSYSVTVSPGFRARIENDTGFTLGGARGNTIEASQAIDTTVLLSLANHVPTAFLPQVAQSAGSRIQLDFAMNTMDTGTSPLAVHITLIAESVD
jgi:hypothetical protein